MSVKMTLTKVCMKRNLLKTLRVKFLPPVRRMVLQIHGFSYMVTVKEAERFVDECLKAAGTPDDHARIVAGVLIAADQKGHYSQGMHRLELILTTIRKGICDPKIHPQILKESSSTVWVDGMRSLGPVVSQFCTEKMISKAKENTVAVICAKNSHYNSNLDYYAQQGMKQGLLVIICGNTPLAMCPNRAKRPVLGSNPICIGAAGENGDTFVYNVSTTAASYGQIVLNAKRNLPLPLGWAKDILGRVTTNPADALEANLLLPLADNKGFGLGMVVEILSSILSDADFGAKLVPYRHYATRRASIGHCFIAVDVEKFAPNFKKLLSELLNTIRKAELVNPRRPISIPGDVEKFHIKQVKKAGGIIYYPAQIDACRHLAQQLHVRPLQYTKKYLTQTEK